MMKPPYRDMKSRVEFWTPALVPLEMEIKTHSVIDSVVVVRFPGLDDADRWQWLRDYVFDPYMIGRCAEYLNEHNRSLSQRSVGGFYFPVHGGHDGFSTEDTCLYSASRDAVVFLHRKKGL